MIISLDTETVGVDFFHGVKPFFVTSCSDEQRVVGDKVVPPLYPVYWEWSVDPTNREPQIPEGDIDEIRECIESAELIVFQNANFDVLALENIGIIDFDWSKVRDTLRAGHMLHSGMPHDLTSMVLRFLDKDIEPYEIALKKAVKFCQNRLRHRMKGQWKFAKKGLEGMPSAKEECWKFDTWLPRTCYRLAVAGYLPTIKEDNPDWESYGTVLSEYANADSLYTLALWQVMEQELKRLDLWEMYLECLKVNPVAHAMKVRGVTVNNRKLLEQQERFAREAESYACQCVSIAAQFNYHLSMPKGPTNSSLNKFCFSEDLLALPIYKATDTGGSLDKESIEFYEHTLEAGPQLDFVRPLAKYKRRCTAQGYLESYDKHKLRLKRYSDFSILHPSPNPTGTAVTRWSMSNPNGQQISKQSETNARVCFGPLPDREWWSMDYQNLELRIPAFEAEEETLIEVFNRPKDPPYFGSYHLVVFDILHPELFAKLGKAVKLPASEGGYEDTYYQWVKNGNFARQYGCQDRKGDLTYHVNGACHLLRSRLPKVAALNEYWKRFANQHGYVEALPDRLVNPRRGYPIMTSRTESGQVMPTIPFCYHVQGSAGVIKNNAEIAVYEQLCEWNNGLPQDKGYYVILDVHDELVFDFPRGKGAEPWKTNLPKIRKLQILMESCGERVGIPTPVSVEYHAESWAVGKSL